MKDPQNASFTNLYGDKDSNLKSAQKRGDWSTTKKILQKHPNTLLKRFWHQNYAAEVVRDFL